MGGRHTREGGGEGFEVWLQLSLDEFTFPLDRMGRWALQTDHDLPRRYVTNSQVAPNHATNTTNQIIRLSLPNVRIELSGTSS